MSDLRSSAGAPAGALFRLLPARWGKLGWFVGGNLFLVWMGWILLGGSRSLSERGGSGIALFWLLAPTLAYVAGHLPDRLIDGFAATPFARSLPGLREGTLRGILLLMGGVGVGVGSTALALGVSGMEAVASVAAALALFLVPVLWTAAQGPQPAGSRRLGASPGLRLLLYLFVLVALHLVWIFAPTLPARVGGGSPGLVALVSLLLFLPLLAGLVRIHRYEPVDWTAASNPGAGTAHTLADLAGSVSVSDSLFGSGRWTGRVAGDLSWGAPPSAGSWRKHPIRSSVHAGHFERSHRDPDAFGWLAEWLFLPVLLVGFAWAFDLFGLFLMGVAVACTFPGLALVGTLPYPLSRGQRARTVWAAHMVHGLAGVGLAGVLSMAAALLFAPSDVSYFGAGPVLLSAHTLAWLPVGFVVDAILSPSRSLDRTSGPTDPRRFAPAGAILAGVMASALGFQQAGLTDTAEILPALTLLAVALHGAGWLFLRWHFGRCNLGPSDV